MTRKLSLAPLALVFSLSLAACGARIVGDDAASADSSVPPHDSGAGPFAGNWSGTSDAAVMYTIRGTDAGSMSATSSSAIRVSITSANPDSMSITISTTDGTGSCTFVAERMGSTATLPAGQTCTQPDAGVAGSYTLRSGSATVSGSTLQVALVMTGTFSNGGTTIDVTNSLMIRATPG